MAKGSATARFGIGAADHREDVPGVMVVALIGLISVVLWLDISEVVRLIVAG